MAMADTATPKLNMKHGFLKSIIKNQIDRDEYHKLMEERKEEYKKELGGGSSSSTTPTVAQATEAPSRPPITSPPHIYVPPHRRRQAMGEMATTQNKKRNTDTSGFVTEHEETRIREKVRAQVKALGDVDVSALKGASSSKEATKALFTLNLSSDGGNVEITVLSSDNPARLSKALARQHALTEAECRLLRETLEREITARMEGSK